MEKEKFRKIILSSGKIALGGKNAENNEELVSQAGEKEIVLHTKAKGSPFVNIKYSGKVTKEDIKEAGIFCARYSQDWKKNKKEVIVHYFLGRDVYKKKDMAMGTFGVKKFKEIVINKEEIESFEEKK
ncbi:DUF814 domain-containing protein [Candidatus Pacearchaeota archaeon]|nr:DUF814 domain-containing protein [Candidatus Pacearchaeota archaeon]